MAGPCGWIPPTAAELTEIPKSLAAIMRLQREMQADIEKTLRDIRAHFTGKAEHASCTGAGDYDEEMIFRPAEKQKGRA